MRSALPVGAGSMLFNSLEYFLFLPAVLAAYYLLRGQARLLLLLTASLFFYMYWNVPYVGLLLFSSVVDYSVARRLDAVEAPGSRKALLAASLTVNLGLLGFFKYYDFFLDTLQHAGLAPGTLSAAGVLLPLGISFYTFQTISYTVDVYRRQIPAERSFPKLLLYVSFFPQLVAGPIVRAADLLPQFDRHVRFEWRNIVQGSRRILGGLIKKVVIADTVAVLVDQAYSAPGEHSGLALLLATWGFALQIYCDFSGYSDIAIGTAKLLGFDLMENFEMPYVSRSIQEFWRRWHISLSTWLRDYLYIPLGGNRRGAGRTYRNLLVTMLLGGLWHGAAINFVVWGGLHGLWLGIERFSMRRRGLAPRSGVVGGRLTSPLRTFAVFNGVCVAWVFFRAQSLGDALEVLTRIVTGAGGASLPLFQTCNALLVVALACAYFKLASLSSLRLPRLWWSTGAFGSVLIVLFAATSHEFIYFIF